MMKYESGQSLKQKTGFKENVTFKVQTSKNNIQNHRLVAKESVQVYEGKTRQQNNQEWLCTALWYKSINHTQKHKHVAANTLGR